MKPLNEFTVIVESFLGASVFVFEHEFMVIFESHVLIIRAGSQILFIKLGPTLMHLRTEIYQKIQLKMHQKYN